MSSQITRIEKESTFGQRYHIYVDGEFVLSVHEDVLVKYRLHKGMDVGEDDCQHWLLAEEQNRARQVAFKYLGFRPRTIHQVRQYLLEKEFALEQIEVVVEEMVHQGYLNDQQYARAWVQERQKLKGLGSARLRQELKQKGIADHWIDEALSYIEREEERQLAMDLAERRYSRIHEDLWPKVERKLGQYLMRRGFSADLVYPILQHFRSIHRRKGEDRL